MKDYHLVFASDVYYLPYTLVAIQSVIDALDLSRSSSDRDRLIFTILIDDTVDMVDFMARCDSFAERNSHAPARIEIRPTMVDRSLFAGFSTWGKHHTHSAFYRLIIDRILPTEVGRALYLDVDMLILADVRELFDSVNLDDKYLAAVLDYPVCCGFSPIIISPRDSSCPPANLDSQRYFNSGLIFFNLDLWRREGLTEKALNLARSYDVKTVDQDVLNMLVTDPLLLHPSWNMMTSNYWVSAREISSRGCTGSAEDFYSALPSVNGISFPEMVSRPGIIHFTAFKPWDRDCFLRTDTDKTALPSEPWHYASMWTAAARRVIEFREELRDAYVDPVNYLNSNLISIRRGLENAERKRRMDRKIMFSVMFALFAISIAVNLIFN